MNHRIPGQRGGAHFVRWVSGALLAASLALAAPMFFGGSLALADSSPQSVTFGCIGFPQLFGVPPGVTQITVNAAGAAGGFGQNKSDPGFGSTVSATLAVTPGDTLQITVGCQGSVTAGGYGGFKGGDGNGGDPALVGTGGGGGGGATVIADFATGSVLLVAAGGGGGGGNGFLNPGGNGGTYVGIDGSGSGLPGTGSGAGNGGIAGAASGPDGESNTQGTPGAGGGGGGGAGYPNGGLSGFSGGDVGGGGGGGAGVSFVDSTVVTGVTQGGAHSFTGGSLTFSYTGPNASPQVYGCTNDFVRYVVPVGVTEISAQLIGADGGNLSNLGDQLGGQGAGLQGIMRVTPGQKLFITVGCHGQPGYTGNPGNTSTTNPGGAGGYGYTHGGNGGAGDRDSGDLTNGAEGGCGGGGSSGILIPQTPPSGGGPTPPGDQLIAGGGGGCGGSAQDVLGFRECCGGSGGNASGPGTAGSNGTDGDPLLLGEPGGSGGTLALGPADDGSGGAGGQNTYLGNLDAGGGGGGGGAPHVVDFVPPSGGGGGTVPAGAGDESRNAGGGGGGGSYTAGNQVTSAGFLDTGAWRSISGSTDGLVVITPLFTSPKDLTVSVTATPTLAHTVTWGISKSVDAARQSIGAGATKATFNYTVTVTHEPGPVSNWKVLGSITVTNPNHDDVSGVTVTDATNNGGTCNVAGGANLTVPGNSSVLVPYLCSYDTAPSPDSGTDTATVSWTDYGSPDTSATGTADFDFTGISGDQTSTIDSSVTVKDSLAGTLGTVTTDDPSSKTFTYQLSFPGVAGTCTNYINTASYTTNTTGTTASKDVRVQVCKAAGVSLKAGLKTTEGIRFSGAVANFKSDADASVAAEFKVQIDWGDGSGPSSGTISTRTDGTYFINGDHIYRDEGSYTLTVTVADASGAQTSATGTAQVADAPLSATPVTVAGTEGVPFHGTVASFTDANPRAPVSDFSATIDWGDGSISAGTIQGDGGSFVVLGTHTYAEEHDGYNTKVSITDTGGQQATVIGTANVADAPLSATPIAVSATEGASFSGSAATFTDADPNGTLTDYSATIDWGDQTSTTAGDITKNADGSYTVSGGHTYVEEGSYSVTVTINDKGGSTTTAKSTATVADAPLTATGGFTITATEGQASASQTVATFTDADPNGTLSDYSASIDWGDGTTATAGTVSENADGSFAVNGDHTYGEEGSYTVTVTISDEGGSQTVANDTASVADAPLTATSQNILSGSGTAYNGAVATFKDANPTAPLSDFSATIDWGDSTAAAGTISQNADGSFTVSGTHTFAALGPHTVTVHIVDEGGSTADATTQILSYAYLGQGSFVLGDQTVANAAPGTTVTWWGAQWDAQWAGNDTLSGGPAPTDFKGFAQSLSGTPPVAGGSWTTLPGTSPMPPDSVPTYMAVIVTSHVTESGSTITGNIVHLVIVKTDPGYGPNAGHAGTGTIVATVF